VGRSPVPGGRAVRNRRRPQGRHVVRDHDVPEEVYREEHRKPSVTFSKDIETDLSRRDFRINAMAIRLPDGGFIDPFAGVRDLAAKRLDTRLTRDGVLRRSAADAPSRPLRRAAGRHAGATVLHAIRICAIGSRSSRWSGSPTSCRSCSWPARDQGPHHRRLRRLAELFLPELPALALEQDPVHRHKDVMKHTFAVVERCEAKLELRLARSSTTSASRGRVRSHRRAYSSITTSRRARMARERLTRCATRRAYR